jgi:hypothetical protein
MLAREQKLSSSLVGKIPSVVLSSCARGELEHGGDPPLPSPSRQWPLPPFSRPSPAGGPSSIFLLTTPSPTSQRQTLPMAEVDLRECRTSVEVTRRLVVCVGLLRRRGRVRQWWQPTPSLRRQWCTAGRQRWHRWWRRQRCAHLLRWPSSRRWVHPRPFSSCLRCC